MAKKTIHIMNTAFRDGFQSVYGARVLTEDFMPAVKVCAEAGQTHFEAGGGARFQAPFFYCNESAFDMMDTFRATAGPDANLQTLARGLMWLVWIHNHAISLICMRRCLRSMG